MIKKYLFYALAIIGVLIISICAFVIPENPYEIIKSLTSVTFDKPLWLNIIIGVSFMYLVVLYFIYDKLNKGSEQR